MRFSHDVALIAGVTLIAGAAMLVGCAEPVTVQPDNAEPVADFTVACTELTCSFTDRSTDSDAGGFVVSHVWDFGDGDRLAIGESPTSSEQNPTHTYRPPGGRFTVTLVVTDDDGARGTTAKEIDVAPGSAPDSAIYERETPHSAGGHQSRYVIRSDGTFEVRDWTKADTTIYTGRWQSACCWFGWEIEPGSYILLDFDGFHELGGLICGEGFGALLMDGRLGIAYCGELLRAGLEEGVYTSGSVPVPGPAPPVAGQIAFVRDGRIYRVNSDGSGLVQLSAGPDDRGPAWSPDGSRIAFTRTSGETTGVLIMDADGSNVVQRTTSGGLAATSPSNAATTWSPDGKWIAFVCSDAEALGLCKVRADNDGTTPDTVYHIGPAGPIDQEIYAPTWSPDGTRIAFISDRAFPDFFYDIWVIAPDGSELTALRTHTALAPNPYGQHQPAWLPDGRRIAHVQCPWAFRFCSSSVITVMNTDGSGAVRLVAASGFARPAWSPDGQVIAFASSYAVKFSTQSANVLNLRGAIEWVSADGSQRGRIIENGHSPAWRPGGLR
jgi:Tol biopolymer transport system component